MKIPVPGNRRLGTSCLSSDIFIEHTEDCAENIVSLCCSFESGVEQADNAIMNSEENVLHAVVSITGALWAKIGVNAQPSLNIGFALNKTELKSTSTTTRTSGRPDETIYEQQFLVSVGEHKAAADQLSDAWSEIPLKMKSYNVVEYGSVIKYLPVYVAAGNLMEFGVVNVVSKEVHKLGPCNIKSSSKRADLIRQSINCLRYLSTLYDHIPRACGRAFETDGRIRFYKDYVEKDILETDTAPDDLYKLLGEGNVPCAAKVEKKRNRLIVTPLGIKIGKLGERLTRCEMLTAVRCVLKCLASLHASNFVHRDIRWPNIIRVYYFDDSGETVVSCTYKVIDFEFAAVNDLELKVQGHWFIDKLGKDNYKKIHDLKQVGKLIADWTTTTTTVIPRDLSAFVAYLESDITATQALEYLNNIKFQD